MKKKLIGAGIICAMVIATVLTVNMNKNEEPMAELLLANVEALAGGESGTTHTLTCGPSGVKMCEATCGRCNVTLKAWGNGKTATMYCSL